MKSKTLLLGLALFAAYSVSMSTMASAQTTYRTRTVMVDHTTGARFKARERGTIDFNGWKHVEKLKIKVTGPVNGLRLWANTQEINPVYVPGPNPYYEAPVNAAIAGLDYYSPSDCQIGGVYMDSVDHPISAPVGYGGGYYGANAGAELSAIQNDVQALRFRFTDENYIQFLRPITDSISQALIMQYSRGDMAQQSMNAVDAVIAQVDFAAAFLQSALTIDSDRNVVIDLLSAKERLLMLRGR